MDMMAKELVGREGVNLQHGEYGMRWEGSRLGMMSTTSL